MRTKVTEEAVEAAVLRLSHALRASLDGRVVGAGATGRFIRWMDGANPRIREMIADLLTLGLELTVKETSR